MPYCTCLFLWNKKYSFFGINSTNECLNFLFSKKKNIQIYAHYLTFDGSIILQNIDATTIFVDGIFEKGAIYKLNLNNSISEIEFKCSYKIFPLKLEEIAKLLNLDKKKFPHSFVTFNTINYVGKKPTFSFFENCSIDEYNEIPDIFSVKDQIIAYCLADVNITATFMQIIYNIFLPFLNIKHLYSISSIALKIFEKHYNVSNIQTLISATDDAIFRQAYFGGRCEVFGNPSNGYIYHFDFTGMYTQVMQEKFPFGNYSISYEIDSIDKPGFYQIEGYSKMEVPILPIHSLDGRLIFANGNISGLYWFEEIFLFLKNGGIINKINYAVFFEKFDFCLKAFAANFFDFRKKSSIHNILGKLIPNSLFGRFGMSIRNYNTEIVVNNSYEEDGSTISENKIANFCIRTYEKHTTDEMVNSNVVIASCITAKARIKLYNALSSVIENNGKLLYTDTDSIFAEYSTNVDNQTHGDIFWDTSKLDTQISDAVFVSGKLYSVIYKNNFTKTKIKGVKHNVSHFKLKQCFYTNIDISIDNVILKKSNYIVKMQHIKKKIKINAYCKRIFSQDKKSTKPLVI